MLTIIITAIVNVSIIIIGYLLTRRKTKAETESIIVQQYDLLVKSLRQEIKENKEEIQLLKNGFKAMEKSNQECEYDHLVKSLELAHIKKLIDLSKLPKATAFVLDDNKMVALEFKKYFREISVLDCKIFTDPDAFLKTVKQEQPEITILDFFISETLTAEDIIKQMGYTPEIFIMSHDKNIGIKIREKGWDFFYKDDFYVQKIAKAVIEYLYHKT